MKLLASLLWALIEKAVARLRRYLAERQADKVLAESKQADEQRREDADEINRINEEEERRLHDIRSASDIDVLRRDR